MKKDNRKVYKNQRVETSCGEVAHFDGKGDPDTKTLKVYRLFGNINKADDFFQAMAFDLGYDKVQATFPTP